MHYAAVYFEYLVNIYIFFTDITENEKFILFDANKVVSVSILPGDLIKGGIQASLKNRMYG